MNKKILYTAASLLVSVSLLTGCSKGPSPENMQVGGVSTLDTQHRDALDSLFLEENVGGYTYLYDIDSSGDPLLIVATPGESKESVEGNLRLDFYKFNESTGKYEEEDDLLKTSLSFDNKSADRSKLFLDKEGYLYHAISFRDNPDKIYVKKFVKNDIF